MIWWQVTWTNGGFERFQCENFDKAAKYVSVNAKRYFKYVESLSRYYPESSQ